MAKRRRSIPLSTQKKLIAELSGICCVPECFATEDLHIHHIDGYPSNNELSNLILLCPNHHASADKGRITKEQCREYRQRVSSLRPIMPDLLRVVDSLVQNRVDQRILGHPETESAATLQCQWTEEGPRIQERDVVISTSESNALLKRWIECIYECIEKEYEKRGDYTDAVEAGQVVASFRACIKTYLSVPREDELKLLETELSRKFDMFYRFSRQLLIVKLAVGGKTVFS